MCAAGRPATLLLLLLHALLWSGHAASAVPLTAPNSAPAAVHWPRWHEYALNDELREWGALPANAQRAIVAGRRCTMLMAGWLSTLLAAAAGATAMALAEAAAGCLERQQQLQPAGASCGGGSVLLVVPPPHISAAVLLKGRQAPVVRSSLQLLVPPTTVLRCSPRAGAR